MNEARPIATRFLRRRADRRALVFLAVTSSLYVIHWLAGASAHWLLIPSAVLAVSICAIKHNHIHGSMFRSPALNRSLNVWLACLTGTSTTGIRMAHNQRHHRHNQSPEDHVRCSLVWRQSAFVAFIGFCPLVIAETWRHARQDTVRIHAKSVSLHRLRMAEQAAIWILICAGLLLDWRQFLWVFPVPWLFGQWFMITINLLQHDGLGADDPLLGSRNVVGTWCNWLFFNNGYHTAHHLHPALHWTLLPAYHRQHIGPHLPPELESRSLRGLVEDWWKARSLTRTFASEQTA